MDTSEEEKTLLSTAPTAAAVPPETTPLEKRVFSDYDTVGSPLPQLSRKSRGLPDYSSIEDILSILPRDATEGNLNVFIVTNDPVGLSTPSGEGKSTATASEGDVTHKTKKIPVYSVVNKFKKRQRDDADDSEVESPESSVPGGNPIEEVASHDLKDMSCDLKLESAPPPPIPPRTYEMNQLESDQAGGDDSLKKNADKSEEETVFADGGVGTTPAGPDLQYLEKDHNIQKFASQSVFIIHSASDARGHSYETVDLVLKSPAGGEEERAI